MGALCALPGARRSPLCVGCLWQHSWTHCREVHREGAVLLGALFWPCLNGHVSVSCPLACNTLRCESQFVFEARTCVVDRVSNSRCCSWSVPSESWPVPSVSLSKSVIIKVRSLWVSWRISSGVLMLCPAESLRGQVQASWEVKGPPANSGAGHNHRSKCLHCVCVCGGGSDYFMPAHTLLIHSFIQ